MKNICSLLIVVLLSLSAYAQVEPMKKANTITITTTDSANVALTNLAKLMQDQGFSIDKLDKELGSVTAKKNFKTVALTANGYVRGNIITLSGTYVVTMGNMSATGKAQYTGLASGGNKASFLEIDKVAKAYEGGKVSYSVR